MKQSKICELSKKQRNCISAAKYRLKKKEMNFELEKRVKLQQKQIEDLQNQVHFLQKKQLQIEKELNSMKQTEIKQNYIIQDLKIQIDFNHNKMIDKKSFTNQELMDMFLSE